MCTPKIKLGLIGSVWFLGWVVTLPFIPRLADIYGRRQLVFIAAPCYLILFYALFACKSYIMILGIFLCFGLLNSIRLGISNIYMLELFPQRSQANFGTVWLVIDASIMLFGSLYFEHS